MTNSLVHVFLEAPYNLRLSKFIFILTKNEKKKFYEHWEFEVVVEKQQFKHWPEENLNIVLPRYSMSVAVGLDPPPPP